MPTIQPNPQEVLEQLKQGNQAFIKGNTIIRNRPERMKNLLEGQHPKAIVLSCIDSRVPVEDIFQQDSGDIFVARIAGNIVDHDIAGSMEYACKSCGARLVFVLGHEDCGAVKSAIKQVKLGNVTGLLEKLRPALEEASQNFEGERTSADKAFVASVCENNVRHTIKAIRNLSPILAEMETKGEILICGGIYRLASGVVEFL